MIKNVKNIIFDLGNVLLDIDIPATERALHHLFGENAEKALKKCHADNIFNLYETGKMGEKAFFQHIRAASEKNITDAQIKKAWNAMLLDFTPARLERLAQLKKKYNLYLLSNTNTTHLVWFRHLLKEKYGIPDFETRFFVKAYYSHKIKLRKPTAEIYEYVVKDAALNPAETLFIDDNADNIAAAQQAGWQTILHPIGAEVVVALKDF
jgi:glucose-1-phosphatase